MINDILYRKSFLEPWLRYVSPTQAEYVVKEIHEESCSMHSGPRPILGSTRKGEVLDRSHWLLYKMGQSKASRNNNGKPSQEVRVGQHRMQIRTARRNRI
ncbi:hypothetical protein Tco_1481117 [Tanacetum coccineum]